MLSRRNFLKLSALSPIFALETYSESDVHEKEFAFPIVFANSRIEKREVSATKIVKFRRDGIFWRLITLFTK